MRKHVQGLYRELQAGVVGYAARRQRLGYRDLDEFTLYNIDTNKFTGRHTTVTSASTHGRSER